MSGTEGAPPAAGLLPSGPIERLIGLALDLDPETRHALAGLSGRAVDLDVTGVGVLRLHIDGERIRVESGQGTAGIGADVTIRGAPLSLVRFACARDRERLILGEEVVVAGDIALATRLQRIVAGMDLDLEEAFARHIGDIPAHELARGLRGLGGWMRASGAALLADASEYLRHEAAATPVAWEVERFSHAVDAVRDDVERLRVRVERLERGGTPQS